MKLKHNNKGITLIALMITIVVLMILAGIVIGTLTGDEGLIIRTQNAKNMHQDGEKLENNTLIDYENLIEETTK